MIDYEIPSDSQYHHFDNIQPSHQSYPLLCTFDIIYDTIFMLAFFISALSKMHSKQVFACSLTERTQLQSPDSR